MHNEKIRGSKVTDLIEIKMPSDNQEGTESVIGSWFKKIGDTINEHEPILEINTDKVTMEIPSPASGTLVKILKDSNDKINPGEVLGIIQPGAGAAKESATNTSAPKSAPLKSSQSSSEQSLSPAVRKLLKEKGIDASEIIGSGPNGRILIEDVEKFTPTSKNSTKTPHTAMRKSIANHMVSSLLKTAPHVTTVFDCDLSNLIANRDKNKNDFASKGVKLTFTPYFVKAAVEALKAVPELNSKWHEDSLELFSDYNIGVATSLEQGGLIVPVIKNAQSLDLFEIASQLQDLTNKARNNSLETKDVQGGTFTITNHGMTGSLMATPIINQPQSGILGVGKLEKRVVVREVNGKDEMVIRPMCYITLTFDHRVTDGVRGNAFLQKFISEIEGLALA